MSIYVIRRTTAIDRNSTRYGQADIDVTRTFEEEAAISTLTPAWWLACYPRQQPYSVAATGGTLVPGTANQLWIKPCGDLLQ